ncbi:cellulase family glycosylhydrolase [Enterococcus diestrammenae]|uniref:Uncharacterized protein n=1 Tax=Enterococcus diestrammenae TaxID=1155073 RepID=A0ABV0F1W3_9ENTE|nr:cellulase family glycosylhydrolase [Enterococcus diestrammenae]KAF1300083.1 hypothetical protein BAU18_08475 [Enterococcus diestrammenae]
MKYVWVLYEAQDGPNMAPNLFSSKKKAMSRFDDVVEYVKERGLAVEIEEHKDCTSASWKETNGYEHSIAVFKTVVR